MDKLQSHIERTLPTTCRIQQQQQQQQHAGNGMMAQAANQEKFQVRNSPFIRLEINNEIKTEPVMIAPSPVPTVSFNSLLAIYCLQFTACNSLIAIN